MFCPNCGTQLPDNAKFCRSCGTKIELPEEFFIPEMPVSQPEPAPAPQPVIPPAAPVKKKSKLPLVLILIALVLAIGIGVGIGIGLGSDPEEPSPVSNSRNDREDSEEEDRDDRRDAPSNAPADSAGIPADAPALTRPAEMPAEAPSDYPSPTAAQTVEEITLKLCIPSDAPIAALLEQTVAQFSVSSSYFSPSFEMLYTTADILPFVQAANESGSAFDVLVFHQRNLESLTAEGLLMPISGDPVAQAQACGLDFPTDSTGAALCFPISGTDYYVGVNAVSENPIAAWDFAVTLFTSGEPAASTGSLNPAGTEPAETASAEEVVIMTVTPLELNVRSSPSVNADRLFILKRGTEVEVLNYVSAMDTGWALIQYQGQQGWCVSSYLRAVE